MGSEAEYLPCDLSRADALQSCLAQVGAPIKLLVHSAGVVQDRWLKDKTSEDLDQVFAAKIGGSQHLLQLSAAVQIEKVVLFSSIASVLGNPGQCDYAYANGYQNQLAQLAPWLSAKGLKANWLSIAWPLWQVDGMQLSAEKSQWLSQQFGFRRITGSCRD